MKIKLLIFIPFFCSNIIAQEYPKNTKHIKTIQSTVYNKKDTLNHRELVTYYDKDWNLLTNTNTLSSALDKGSKTVTILDTDKKFVQAIITSKKDTLDYIVYLYDDDGNRTNNYQIRKGDTITDQKRIFDDNGNSLELYNKKNGKYYLSLEAKYNDLNKVTSRNWYNSLNQLIRIEKFEYSEDGKTSEYYKTDKKGVLKRQSKKVEIGRRKYKIYHYTESKGINYGITLEKQKGYYTIEEKDENDNLISLEIFNKRDKLKTSVYVTYSEIQH